MSDWEPAAADDDHGDQFPGGGYFAADTEGDYSEVEEQEYSSGSENGLEESFVAPEEVHKRREAAARHPLDVAMLLLLPSLAGCCCFSAAYRFPRDKRQALPKPNRSWQWAQWQTCRTRA